jgi:hypothetical protein
VDLHLLFVSLTTTAICDCIRSGFFTSFVSVPAFATDGVTKPSVGCCWQVDILAGNRVIGNYFIWIGSVAVVNGNHELDYHSLGVDPGGTCYAGIANQINYPVIGRICLI